ncbi:MAG: hypothetical protein V4617_16310 [Gemmatimonadota bacterium]
MLLPAGLIEAQTASASMRTPPPDSAAWPPLLTHVMGRLASHITRAALDTTPQPWRMTFPDSGLRWQQVEAHLRSALRARSVTPADSMFYELSIGALTVKSDTARIELRDGVTRPCANGDRPAGFGNVEQVFVVRYQSGSRYFWGGARSPNVLHGDRAPCSARRRQNH